MRVLHQKNKGFGAEIQQKKFAGPVIVLGAAGGMTGAPSPMNRQTGADRRQSPLHGPPPTAPAQAACRNGRTPDIAGTTHATGDVGLRQVFDHPYELVAPKSMLPGELDELTCPREDGSALGGARHGDAAAPPKLEQPLLAQEPQGAKDRVGVHAQHRGQVAGGWASPSATARRISAATCSCSAVCSARSSVTRNIVLAIASATLARGRGQPGGLAGHASGYEPRYQHCRPSGPFRRPRASAPGVPW